MSRAFAFRAFVVASLAGLLVVGALNFGSNSAARGKTPSAKSRPGKTPASSIATTAAILAASQSEQSKIAIALARSTDLEFIDMPLREIVRVIAAKSEINILLDAKPLADARVTSDTKFTESAKGIPLGSALHLLLSQKDLSYFAANDDVLMITTADVAKAHVVLRVYDVRDFAEPVAESISSGSSPPATAKTAQSNPQTASPANAMQSPASGGFLCRTGATDQFGSLSEVITSSVVPSSWDSSGGFGSLAFYGDRMVVAQTEEVHQQMVDLLEELRAAKRPSASSGEALMLQATSPYVAKIQKALDERIDLDFAELPLREAINQVSTKAHVNIQLGELVSNDPRLRDAKITFSVKDVALREALSLLLKPKDLAAIIRDDVLLITSDDAEKSHVVVAVYPIASLLDKNPMVNSLTGQPQPEFDSLIEAITTTVEPTTWDSNGGAGTIAPFEPCKSLVIAQTPQAHRKIRALLTLLAAARSVAPTQPQPSDEPRLHIFRLGSIFDSPSADQNRRGLEQLVVTIRHVIEPKSWASQETYLGIVNDSLVVRQRPDVLQQIQQLIDNLTERAFLMGGMGGGAGNGLPKN